MLSCVLAFTFFLVPFLSAMEGLTPIDFQRLHAARDPRFSVSGQDVGQGSCVVLGNKKNGHYYMVDGGTSGNAPVDIVNRVVAALGRAEVHSDLPTIVQAKINITTSHADKDHINIFPRLFTLNGAFFVQLETFILGDLLKSYEEKEDGKELIKKVLNVVPDKIKHVEKYISNYPLPGGFLDHESSSISSLSILCSNAGDETSYHKNKNTNSAIVRFSINDHNILIMGDASAFTTRRYMIDPAHRATLQNIELLFTSHHGAKDEHGSNDGLWLSQIRPKRVAISAGFYYNGHPDLTLFQDLIMIDCLEDYVNVLAVSGLHKISIGIPEQIDIPYASEQLNPFFTFAASCEDHPKWSAFNTQKFIYNTASSGNLLYTFYSDGVLANFLSEY